MIKSQYKVVGVMSGTSLDGLDLCYVNFNYQHSWSYKIIRSETIKYTNEWTDKLSHSMLLSEADLGQLDETYTRYLNSAIHTFINTHVINDLDAICSHGHTVLHQPDKGITYQIGNMPHISKEFKCPVVCDFRIDDVKLMGQGAPLVPIGDALLFKEFDICLNLGGFANMSFEDKSRRVAYDICPVNIILNHYVKPLGFDYDDGGNIAKSGVVNQQLLNLLNELEFYKLAAPKSLGLEWVQSHIFPLIATFKLPVEIILRTLVAHTATQIANEINKVTLAKVLITGGGAYNTFLIEQIIELTENEIVIPTDDIVNYKEALVFGFLGVLKLRNEVNCLSSVTGAKKDHSSGRIY